MNPLVPNQNISHKYSFDCVASDSPVSVKISTTIMEEDKITVTSKDGIIQPCEVDLKSQIITIPSANMVAPTFNIVHHTYLNIKAIDSKDAWDKQHRWNNQPHGWLQWKGTDVGMDFYCICGEHGHIDDSFTYTVKCPACKRTYSMNGHVQAIELSKDDEHSKLLSVDGYEEVEDVEEIDSGRLTVEPPTPNVEYLDQNQLDVLEDICQLCDESNVPAVRANVKASVMTFLNEIGLTNFTVVCDESNNPPSIIDRGESVVCDITIDYGHFIFTKTIGND